MSDLERIAELARISKRIAEMSETNPSEVQQAALVLLGSLSGQILKYATTVAAAPTQDVQRGEG